MAGATTSGIAAVTGWLILARRSRPRTPVRVARPSGTTVTVAHGRDLDLEIIRKRPEGGRNERYAEAASTGAAASLWRAQDDRPRWIRRLNDQVPARPPASRSRLGPDEEPMPWLDAMSWTAGDGGDEEIAR